MCDPVTLISAGAAVFGAYTQVQAGKAAEKQGEYNAAIAENKAVDAKNRGRVEENRQRRITAAQIGRQRTQFAANGVALDSGSANDILADTAEIGELDALTIRGNAEREAQYHRSQARQDIYSGQVAKRQSYFGAGSTLLTGAAKASSYWKRPQPASG